MTTMTAEQLLRLKEKIEKGKTRLAELQGQKQQLMKSLAADYRCKTLEEASELVKEQDKKIRKMEERIEEETLTLKETYPILFE
jgi:hypothetical protein